MRRKFLKAAIFALIPLMFFSCQRKVKVKGVSLQVNFSEQILTDNLITDIQYKWKTSSDFLKLNRDYKVFVHFWHNNNMLFQDDHFPAISTSKWEAGQEYPPQNGRPARNILIQEGFTSLLLLTNMILSLKDKKT